MQNSNSGRSGEGMHGTKGQDYRSQTNRKEERCRVGERYVPISLKFRRFCLLLAMCLLGVFVLLHLLMNRFREGNTRIVQNYSLFADYWNEMQEADRILYRYAQTPLPEEREEGERLLDAMSEAAGILRLVVGVPEMDDLAAITDNVEQAGKYILSDISSSSERLSAYQTVSDCKWILEGLHDTLHERMQSFLEREQAALVGKWQTRSRWIMGGGFAIVILFVWWINHLARHIIHPVEELTAQAERIANGDRYIELQYQDDMSDELDILNNSFYRMVEVSNQSYDSLKRQKELEQRLASTRIRLLQSRVNPHFMFNTLNLIVGLAVEEDADRTTQMLILTANYLRYALTFLDKAVCLEEEVRHAMDYMDIQKVRFEERIQVELSMDETSKKAIVPSMILQPLCENALEYGMGTLKRTTTIRLSTQIRGSTLLLTVEDNGMGMDAERLAEVRGRLSRADEYDDTQGIGMVNTFQRLQSFYKDYGFGAKDVCCEVESSPMERTMIRFCVPLVFAAETTSGEVVEGQ